MSRTGWLHAVADALRRIDTGLPLSTALETACDLADSEQVSCGENVKGWDSPASVAERFLQEDSN